MNTKRRIFALIGTLLIISSLLAACAGTPTPVAAPATEAPAAEAPAVAPVTITVMTNRVGTQAQLLQDLANKFMAENPDIKVDFSAPGADYEKLMKVKMAANDMPDVFATHGWAKIRYGEFLLDLRDQPWVTQLDPAIKPAVTDDTGKVYVLPMDQEKTGPAFNADILQEYGLEVPLTWKDFMAACETIKTKSEGKVVCVHMGGSDSWTVGQYYDFFSTALAISPTPNDAQALLDGTYEWDNYTVLSQNLLDLKTNGYLNVDALTAKYTDSAVALAQGKAAFGFYGPFICDEALNTNPDFNCGIMPIPAIAEGDQPTFAGGELTTWGVWKDSKHVDAAIKFVNFFAQLENVKAVAESNKVPAGLTGVQVDAGYLTQYYTQYADLRTFTYFDRIYLPNGMWDVLCKNGQDVLAGGITPEQATDNIGKEYARLREAQ
jgi:raffinose/stachyose/melibiose transport system substrate-binding protein